MLEINVTTNDNEVTVSPTGRIDTTTYVLFRTECMKVVDTAHTMVLDFENVEYISSAGLKVILMLQQTQDKNNRLLKVSNVNEFVMDILCHVGFLEFLTIKE